MDRASGTHAGLDVTGIAPDGSALVNRLDPRCSYAGAMIWVVVLGGWRAWNTSRAM